MSGHAEYNNAPGDAAGAQNPGAAMNAQPARRAARIPSLQGAILKASLLVFFDAFVLNQGIISALVGFGLLLIGLPLALLRRNELVRAARLRNLAIYGAAVALVFVLNGANNRLAKYRAEALVSAVQAFQQKYHRYPLTLNEMAPEFVDSIPLAKYTLGQNTFYYLGADKGDPILFYVSLPPFGRPLYRFGDNKWGYLD